MKDNSLEQEHKDCFVNFKWSLTSKGFILSFEKKN